MMWFQNNGVAETAMTSMKATNVQKEPLLKKENGKNGTTVSAGSLGQAGM